MGFVGVSSSQIVRMAQPVKPPVSSGGTLCVGSRTKNRRQITWPQNRPPQGDSTGSGLLGHDGILIDPERERRNIDEDPDRRKRKRAVESRRHIVHGKAPTQDLQQLRAAERDEVHQARDGKRKAVFRRDDLMQESAQQATTQNRIGDYSKPPGIKSTAEGHWSTAAPPDAAISAGTASSYRRR